MLLRIKEFFACYWVYIKKMFDLIGVLINDKEHFIPTLQISFGTGFNVILTILAIPLFCILFFWLSMGMALILSEVGSGGHYERQFCFLTDQWIEKWIPDPPSPYQKDTDDGSGIVLFLLKLFFRLLIMALVFTPSINSVYFYHSNFGLGWWSCIWRVTLRDIVLLIVLVIVAFLVLGIMFLALGTVLSAAIFLIALPIWLIAGMIDREKKADLGWLWELVSNPGYGIGLILSAIVTVIALLIVVYVPSAMMLLSMLG